MTGTGDLGLLDLVRKLDGDRQAVDRLAELVADRVADLVADRLAATLTPPPAPASERRLVDAVTVANALGTTAQYVREHADDLGAVRLGTGPRPRLRFDLEELRARRGNTEPVPAAERAASVSVSSPLRARSRARRRAAPGIDLLPINHLSTEDT